MADCEGEKTIHYEEDGWSVTLTRYVSMELGETVASWEMGQRRICNA